MRILLLTTLWVVAANDLGTLGRTFSQANFRFETLDKLAEAMEKELKTHFKFLPQEP